MTSTPAPSPPLSAHLLTALVATGGGAIAWLLNIPLPWMLGAMAATGALAWNDRAAVAAPVRPIALLCLGLGLGQTFTTPVLAALATALPWLVVAAVVSIIVGALVARFFARMAGTDARTGYFSAVPGGVIVMAVLAQRYGVSVPSVTLAQTIRVMVVVVIFPPLITWLAPRGGAGAFFAERPAVDLVGLAVLIAAGLGVALLIRMLNLANPWMLGPCALVIALSAFEMLPSGVPLWMIDAAQVGMGAGLGQRMSKRFLLASRRLALASVGSTLILSALMAALGIGLGLISGLPPAASVLGMAPGGMPEMTITAKALDLAVPLVLGFHLVRTVVCNLLVGPVWKVAERLGLDR
ncbi:AbrB family transcriptional regulator [Falsiroseomonas sp.]|uniref:AbrB family transcriptional regulator n=1 Tax=Falsiroseomonas sp. TaxID=2870721 RepID=UPI0027242245|nr:AbrB family transcriptional regulator [Falsiroseomonas sp.]MDO9503546.1 AbrB family transcriptional regulator [Falsiroseomonas sp.]MDP3414526.1 AbrB family transcriptional regulator [Falsiroseomonas sp.]